MSAAQPARLAGAAREDPTRLLESALALHQAGRLAEAEPIYRAVLSAHPGEPDALHLLGVLHHQGGNPTLAADLIGRAIALRPRTPVMHNNLGAALRSMGQLHEAERSFRQALTLDPNYVDARANLARTLASLDRLDEALREFDRALALAPAELEVQCDRGEVQQALGRLDEAIDSFERVRRAAPTWSRGALRLGVALDAAQRASEAVTALEHAATLDPESVEAAFRLGAALQHAGRCDGAIAAYRRTLELEPDHVDALCSLGVVFQQAGRPDEALDCYWRVLDLDANHAAAYNNLGTLFQARGEIDDALTFYKMAVQLQPDHAGALTNLGAMQNAKGLPTEAEASLQRALELDPTRIEAYSNLGGVHQVQGRFGEAVACYRRALELDPDHTVAHANLIFALDMDPAASAETVFAERRQFNEQHARPLAPTIRSHQNHREPNRRLRVGYLSADFRHHSAASTFMPVLLNHDPEQVELTLYSGVSRPDEITQRCREIATRWRDVGDMSDAELAEQIRRDGIDILVDLSGYSSGNRLLVLARKPAPIQITAWGHAVGTGLDAVDYFLGDAQTVPVAAERHFSERVVRLPSIIPFWAPDPPLDVSPTPARARSHVTFGSLNRIHKITAEVLVLWARVLCQVPGSRLLLKYAGLDKPNNQRRFLDVLTSHGVAEARVAFLGGSSRRDHLAAYAEIDVALDPFPHGGGVTALEGLWMGVPLVTLLGDGVPGRLSASFLGTIGHPELIAATTDDYVGIAAGLAADIDRLDRLRRSLREALTQSILCDGPAYCRAVEQAYRRVWQDWCAGSDSEPVEGLSGRAATDPRGLRACLDEAQAHQALRDPAAAEAAYARALLLAPDDPDLLLTQGHLLLDRGETTRAIQVLERARDLGGERPRIVNALGVARQQLGDLDEAITSFRRVLELDPNDVGAHGNLVFTLDLHPLTTADQALAARRAFDQRHARPLASMSSLPLDSPDPERPLRVGYVSADFCRHSAAYVFAPVLLNHDVDRFEVVCYSGTQREDDLTERLRRAASAWRDVRSFTDGELADQVGRDRVDILVDLSGYSYGNRLLTFARRPAPIQVTAWGYATGTGLDAMDYFFADVVTVPPGMERGFAERIVRLPSIVPYAPPGNLGPIAASPWVSNRYVTFGSLNRPGKITESVLDVWGTVLARAPSARLLLKFGGLDDPGSQDRILARLARRGVAPNRIEILGGTGQDEHLAAYDRIDVALDPFPHGGGVTTLEGLWMGVPAVTLLGERIPARLSASFLQQLELEAFVATSIEDYVTIAVDLAHRPDLLAAMRPTLRSRLAQSVVCDAPRYTRAVEHAYREMWKVRCAQ